MSCRTPPFLFLSCRHVDSNLRGRDVKRMKTRVCGYRVVQDVKQVTQKPFLCVTLNCRDVALVIASHCGSYIISKKF
jgi:hypothetical protein